MLYQLLLLQSLKKALYPPMPTSSIKEIWKKAWNSPIGRPRLIAIIILIPVFLFSLPIFFTYIEKRNGVVLHDWLLEQIAPHNVSVIIFAVIWGMVILMLSRSLRSPSILITYCLTLTVVTVMRVICLTLVPLAPPAGLIPLIDPISGIFYGEAAITKDLFFSGHTATLATIYFSLQKRTDKFIGVVAVITVAILLVLQHIHYTIDILAAPVITFMCYRFTQLYLYNTPLSKEE